eukprot:124622-Prymnesium_polylepis.1
MVFTSVLTGSTMRMRGAVGEALPRRPWAIGLHGGVMVRRVTSNLTTLSSPTMAMPESDSPVHSEMLELRTISSPPAEEISTAGPPAPGPALHPCTVESISSTTLPAGDATDQPADHTEAPAPGASNVACHTTPDQIDLAAGNIESS